MGAKATKIRSDRTEKMQLNSRLGLLSLPPELRCEIYQYISPTLPGFDYNDWRGVYASCHLIKHEMDIECSKPLMNALRTLLSQHSVFAIEAAFFNSSIYLHAPTKFSHLKNIRMTLHIDVERY
jgi:hypothetical protein